MSRKLIDMTGRVFGKLVVLDLAETRYRGNAVWVCRCACGGYSLVVGADLRSGKIQSCCGDRHAATRNYASANRRKLKQYGGVSCFGGGKVRRTANTQSANTNKAKGLLRRLEKLGVK